MVRSNAGTLQKVEGQGGGPQATPVKGGRDRQTHERVEIWTLDSRYMKKKKTKGRVGMLRGGGKKKEKKHEKKAKSNHPPDRPSPPPSTSSLLPPPSALAT